MQNRTITAPKGFLAAGIRAGIKDSGRPDLGLIVCPDGATAAAVFTTNKISAAPVHISSKHITSRRIFAVVVNSGNANACTGSQGIKDAVAMCRQVAACANSHWPDHKVQPSQVLVASTGVIGHHLPMKQVLEGIRIAWKGLSSSARAGLAFATAIMTTDTRPKQAVRTCQIAGQRVTIAGTVKGAGMIGPHMATTLCLLTTDCAIPKHLLARALRQAINQTINRLTVDGLQSTNDTAIIMASGLAVKRPIAPGKGFERFCLTLLEICDDLLRQMALDAEGATRMFKVVVKGAATKPDAALAARAVANYPLVKCAIHGGDPNWGRIICAVGSIGVRLDPRRLSCRLDQIYVFRNGAPCRFDRKAASSVIRRPFHTITVDLGVGSHTDFCYGVDLSEEYVQVNAEYHT